MKQVLQDVSTGEIEIAEVPAPQLLPGCVLVRIAASLVSAGTERAASEFASKSLFRKAQARPDLVREVWAKTRREGIVSTIDAIRNRLDQPLTLGYSSAGTVTAVGEEVFDICVGDRVACAGAGYAVHAEVACVPRLLVAKIPTGLPHPTTPSGQPPAEVTEDTAITGACSLAHAAFTTMGAVALHGIRVAEVKLGDTVAVLGLGLLGQLTVQLLKAAGCHVLGIDLLPERASLALQAGADAATASSSEFRDLCAAHTWHRGVDAVLITAETPSSTPINLAAEVARDRGTVVAIGTVGMDIERKLYYDKELNFRVSRSYGPGRYDTAYEQKGRDYPIGYVRWTETRNMEAFLDLLAAGKLRLDPLITHRFPVEQAHRAYDLIAGRTTEPFLGILITYPERTQDISVVRPRKTHTAVAAGARLRLGLLGAGNFATGTLLPAIRKCSDFELVGVCSSTGVHSRKAAEKFSFQYCTCSDDRILNDPGISTIVIATRNHLHARQTLAALRAGKHVFCEKPLCLSQSDLLDIVRCQTVHAGQKIMVGFNRRFAPMTLKLQSFLANKSEPLAMHYRVNAGFLPGDHWVNDPEQGGGRILGEVCHFVDLLCFIADSFPIEVHAYPLSNPGHYSADNMIIWLSFADGSQGTISYLANGDRSFSKERLEVFGGGSVAVMDDFRRLELVRHGRKQVIRSPWSQDKGHRAEWAAFADALKSGRPSPISFHNIVATTLTTLRIKDSVLSGTSVCVDIPGFIASAGESPQDANEPPRERHQSQSC